MSVEGSVMHMNVNTKELAQNMRRVVVKQLCSQCVLSEPCYEMDNGCFFDQAANIIEGLTSTDMKPVVRGQWLEKDGVLHPLETDGICTVCGYVTGFYNFFNFCPKCGADMRPEEGE